LIEALVAQGKVVDAQRALDPADLLSKRTQLVFARLQIAIAAARLEATVGRTTKARKGLTATLSEATRRGFYGLELECRLTLGQLEVKSGEGAGRIHLEALQAEARAKGYGLIVRKAADALGANPQSRTAAGGP
jgi:hypothetical protein